jgi:hypothetical protein
MDSILANILAFSGKKENVNAIKGPTISKESKKVPQVESLPSKNLAVLCFSKDRPYQLHQLLLSIARFVPDIKDICVLYVPGVYQDEYDQVFGFHFSAVRSVLEEHFYSDVLSILNSFHEKDISHVMFCVDDLIFVNYVHTKQVTYYYSSYSFLTCFSLLAIFWICSIAVRFFPFSSLSFVYVCFYRRFKLLCSFETSSRHPI